MKDRRPLVDGVKSPPPSVDPKLERDFVYGDKRSDASSSAQTQPVAPHSRVPISTRVRSDFAAALKRASLERQLNSQEPNTLQDILEQAIEPWLRSNGYLSS